MAKKSVSNTQLILKSMGPGIITGAADDDPSGIGTYTQAGAQFGTRFLWAALITWPLMAAVQMACARIGMVTGEGLASALEKKFPRWVLISFCAALFFANTLNVGADLAAMADGAEMVSGVPSIWFVVIFGLLITWATVELSYHKIAKVLKWLGLSLFAYIITAFLVGPDWGQALKSTFLPKIPAGSEEWSMLVAILGTTISPYLFFWQASQEVEEEKSEGRTQLAQREGATQGEIKNRKYDVGAGTFFSNIVMYFIILTAALTLHKHGLIHVESSKQAAEALVPIAGHFASLLYTLGLLGVGFLAIPTLTGSAAYAIAETFHWDQGLDAKPQRAKAFYSVVVASMLIAVIFDFSNINPLKALYWSAVANGILAPFVLAGVFFIIKDKVIMKGQTSSRLGITVVGICTVMMFAAVAAMVVL
jgi:NRAMP (natural resistance-associated macrophage protein)-like metal ion transporter